MPAPVRPQASSQQWKWELLEAKAFLTDTTLEAGFSGSDNVLQPVQCA